MNAISLKQLQKVFKAGVKSGKMSPAAQNLIRESPDFRVDQRVRVYHDGFWIRMQGSFSDDFIRVKEFLGDSLFEASVRDCIRKFPSRSWSLGEVSQNYSKIVALKKYSGSLPFLRDLAEWEWNRTKLGLVAAPEVFDFSELGNASPKEIENLKLSANSTVIFQRTHWNLVLKRPRRSKSRMTFAHLKGSRGVRSVRVSPNEQALLKYLGRPRSLAEITGFLEKKKLRSSKVTALFSRMTQHQLLEEVGAPLRGGAGTNFDRKFYRVPKQTNVET